MTARPSTYMHTYNTYSGVDIIATMTPTGGKPVVIGELQTISYSIHRDKFPVRVLGKINPIGFTTGGRTIAGSLIFTVFDRHIIMRIIDAMNSSMYESLTENDREDMKMNMKMDELPPIDITIAFKNELGDASNIKLYGITFVDEGQVMSIEDMITEQTMSYMAQDIELIKVGGDLNGL